MQKVSESNDAVVEMLSNVLLKEFNHRWLLRFVDYDFE